MPIDISKLSAKELDDLLSRAAKRREDLKVGFPQMPPTDNIRTATSARWGITPTDAGTLFQICDPGYGWLSFMLDPTSRALLATDLLKHCILPKADGNAAPMLSPTVGGGGNLH